MNPLASKISLPVFMFAVWHTGIAVCTLPVVAIHWKKLIHCVGDSVALLAEIPLRSRNFGNSVPTMSKYANSSPRISVSLPTQN